MGLIKMAAAHGKDVLQGGLGAIDSVLSDKFKRVIRCDNLGDNILMMQKTTETGRIPKDSAIVVQPGQMAVIVDSGRVADAVTDPGVYTFDESSTPCFAAGDFEGSLKEMWSRFTFGGATQKSQQVYYFNTLEIRDNGFGTRGPVVYKDWDHPVTNPRTPSGQIAMSVSITAFGNYTFKIANPALFMSEVCGTAKIFEKSSIISQLQAEFIGTFQQLLNKMGTPEYKVPVLELPNSSDVIKNLLREKNTEDSFAKRGLKLENITIENVNLDEASQKKINQYELGGDVFTQRGVTTEAYGEAMVNASKNTAGVGSAMMGIGFLNMGDKMFGANSMQNGAPAAPGMSAPGMAAPGMAAPGMAAPGMTAPGMAAPGGGTAPGAAASGVVCSCGATITGKFCPNCGKPAPQPSFCPNCGNPVTGKFCSQCGTPVSQKKMCPDCEIEVTGKFCPNCGKPVS